MDYGDGLQPLKWKIDLLLIGLMTFAALMRKGESGEFYSQDQALMQEENKAFRFSLEPPM